MAIFEAFEDPFWKFLLVIFFSLNDYDVFKSYWGEIGIFRPKTRQKAPRDQLGPHRMTNYFFRVTGIRKPYGAKKNFRVYSKKK